MIQGADSTIKDEGAMEMDGTSVGSGARELDGAIRRDLTRELDRTSRDGVRSLGRTSRGGRTPDGTGLLIQPDGTGRGGETLRVETWVGTGSVVHKSISHFSSPGSGKYWTVGANSGMALGAGSGMDMVAGPGSVAGVGSCSGSVASVGSVFRSQG